MRAKYFDHPSDIEVEVYGTSWNQLFANVGKELFRMIASGSVELKVKRIVKLTTKDMESLLYDWLDKLIGLNDSEGLLLEKFDVRVEGSSLKATVSGEKFDSKRHTGNVVVKAPTYHQMAVGKRGKVYYAHFVVDI